MQVPKYIQDKMRRSAELHRRASVLSLEIDDYFERQGIDIDVLRCGNGISLEELDLGNDVTDEFVVWVERDFEP